MLTINIFETSEGEWQYDIYNCDLTDAANGADPLDGGVCTTTLENALGMAVQQAQDLIKRN